MTATHESASSQETPRGAEIRTLREAWRMFRLKGGPRTLGLLIVAAIAVRIAVGGASWRDAVAVAVMLAVYPVGEWVIHVHILHLPPFRLFGRPVEFPSAASHRSHHEDPHRLDLVNLAPAEAVGLVLVVIPAIVGVGALVLDLVFGTPPLAPLVTAALTGSVLVAIYEWTHFLIHTAYRPRTHPFQTVSRTHRLHHFKNEHAWFGVATTLGDRIMGTSPDPKDVPRSATARTLR